MNFEPAADFDRDEALVAELHGFGLWHLVRLQPDVAFPPWPATDLIVGLASHRQARFRAALILLFLRRPSLSAFASALSHSLSGPPANILRLYYQAAVYLRPELETGLQSTSDETGALPDLFSAELGLPAAGSVPPGSALMALGEVHARLSGRAYNWAGSYRQHIPLFLRQLRRSAHADISARTTC